MAIEQMQHCFNCGAELGVYKQLPGDFDTCGRADCAREQRAIFRQQREEAHEALAENATLRYALSMLADAVRTVDCPCSVGERDSGHHIDCYMPRLALEMESVRAALSGDTDEL